jgi:hypothetical protein
MPEQTVQEKLDQLVQYASDIHEDTSTTLIEDNKKSSRQNKILIGIVGIQSVVLVVALVLLGILLSNSFDNKDTLTRLDKNQAGIDELVTFVHTVQDQQNNSNSGSSQVVTDLKTLICANQEQSLELMAACNAQGIPAPTR